MHAAVGNAGEGTGRKIRKTYRKSNNIERGKGYNASSEKNCREEAFRRELARRGKKRKMSEILFFVNTSFKKCLQPNFWSLYAFCNVHCTPQ